MTDTAPIPAKHAQVDDQLCFALYAASRAVTGAYRTRLTDLGLTYPQYVTMLAVWEADGRTVSELGQVLSLDSGTLSPVLKRLESEGWIRRERSAEDERIVRVFSTPRGYELEPKLAEVREAVEECTGLSAAEFVTLRTMLHRLRDAIDRSE